MYTIISVWNSFTEMWDVLVKIKEQWFVVASFDNSNDADNYEPDDNLITKLEKKVNHNE